MWLLWPLSTAAILSAVLALPGSSLPDPESASVPSLDRRSTSKSLLIQREPLLRMPSVVCKAIRVKAGDSCGSLASACKISGSNLEKYNAKKNFCSILLPGQYVCCSPGSLPDYRPKPSADGTCARYTVTKGDSCGSIASTYTLSVNDIIKFNRQTWAWSGCEGLRPGMRVCVSSGNPPIPAPISTAVCGPQKPGTIFVKGRSLASLNACPLNTCCNGWGQCGTTAEFCTDTRPSGSAEGSFRAGTNGCISNCGMKPLVGAAPIAFIKVGYFQARAPDRPCLRMDITSANKNNSFTHIHFAFARIDPSFNVDVSPVQSQFDKFVQLKGVKRILSFGGGSFSNKEGTAPVFKQGVAHANRARLAENISVFAKKYNLDGVDIDWEYPESLDEGIDYLNFIKKVRQMLPAKMSLSIAAPASYWHLKQYPISELSQLLNYVVFMTYDLHGQWDYNKQRTDPDCPGGNCLRSHVNYTETYDALAMITKAGVPSRKVVVGLASYGRSFRMTTLGCTGPTCRFEGPKSSAKPGRCTQTAGTLANAEIKEILRDPKRNATTWRDVTSNSDIMVYDSLEWVAYLSVENKRQRTQLYKSLNMGGTVDWAIDLEDFVPDFNSTI